MRASVGRPGRVADLQRDDGDLVGIVLADLADAWASPADRSTRR